MDLVDANVLLYAVNRADRHHETARRWLDAALGGAGAVGFAWVALLAFLRLGTRRGVFPRPLSLDAAFAIVEEWLVQPTAVIVEPTLRHAAVMRGLLQPLGTAGNLVTDAHLAALAVEHGARIVSYDRDFGRFPGVRQVEPDRA